MSVYFEQKVFYQKAPMRILNLIVRSVEKVMRDVAAEVFLGQLVCRLGMLSYLYELVFRNK